MPVMEEMISAISKRNNKYKVRCNLFEVSMDIMVFEYIFDDLVTSLKIV